MSSIQTVTLEVDDPAAATSFYTTAFGPDLPVSVWASEAPTSGFRGFTLSLIVSQPADVEAVVGAAADAGATILKAPTKSLWGYGGVVQAPDGTIWQVATSTKKDNGRASTRIHQAVLMLGVESVTASKRFYVDRGMTVAKSFGSRYVDFEAGSGPVNLALYKRRAVARVAGVPPEGDGSHRVTIGSDGSPFTDPDGFVWESAAHTV